MKLTHHQEILPSHHPLQGPQHDAGRAAAHQELQECRELLRHPSELYTSPRMRRRYQEAQAAVKLYS